MSEFHIFPFARVAKDAKVIIWGAGHVGTQYFEQLLKTAYCRVESLVDRNYAEMKHYIVNIQNPTIIKKSTYDYIVIAQSNEVIAKEIYEELLCWKVDKKKIVWEDLLVGELEDFGTGTVRYKHIETLLRKILHDINDTKNRVNLAHIDDQKIRRVILSQESLLLNSVYGNQLYSDTEMGYYKKMHSYLHVMTPQRYNFIHIGNKEGDGGYVLINDLIVRKNKIAYSFGINDDVSFDKEMTTYGYDLFMYDHTIDKLPEENDRFHFVCKGLASSNTPVEDKMETLHTFLHDNNHLEQSGMILKADVEGAEYGFIKMTESRLLKKFDQIVLEFHNILSPDNYQNVLCALEKLSLSHIPVHIHINNYNILRYVDNAIIGNTMEITFANKDTYTFAEGYNDMSKDIRNCPDRIEPNISRWNNFFNDDKSGL